MTSASRLCRFRIPRNASHFSRLAFAWPAPGSTTRAESQQHGRDARRREILLAACFAETYLFEWVRDEVLQHKIGPGPDHHKNLLKYFPVGKKRGAYDKWREIPRQLADDGYILGCPDLGNCPWWIDFCTLLNYRDGLIHASASRPEVSSIPCPNPQAAPVPNLGVLEDMSPGWPLGVVVTLVREFNSAAGRAALLTSAYCQRRRRADDGAHEDG